jgi:Protein of unknown function (DUF2971)
MKLYYLTAAHYAISNLSLRRIRISRFSDLNDPFELLAVNRTDPRDRTALVNFKNKINETKGLICFSSGWSNPVLWGHYGDKHHGICLGFEVQNDLANKVKYSDNLIKIPKDRITGIAKPNQQTVDQLIRRKFKNWNYENEWRVFCELDPSTEENGNYFCEFSEKIQPTEIILGCRCEIPSQKIQDLANSIDPKISVVKAKISDTSFAIKR